MNIGESQNGGGFSRSKKEVRSRSKKEEFKEIKVIGQIWAKLWIKISWFLTIFKVSQLRQMSLFFAKNS